MKKIALVLLLAALLAGCSPSVNQKGNTSGDLKQSGSNNSSNDQQVQGDQAATSTSGPDCYGPEAHPIGEAIANQFDEKTSYEQVMVWFCNGIEFDDILSALQTEQLSGVDSSELLEMLSGGQTWDQIWVAIGLTEE